MATREVFDLDMWPGYGLLAGAAVGGVAGLLLGTGALTLGIAFGAALGLVVGAVLRGNRVTVD